MSVLMSVIPSIFARSPRTEAAQPPHVMFGTLSDTRIPSTAFAAAGGVANAFVGAGADCSAQPAIDTANPPVSSTGTNRFTMLLLRGLVTNIRAGFTPAIGRIISSFSSRSTQFSNGTQCLPRISWFLAESISEWIRDHWQWQQQRVQNNPSITAP